MATRRGRTTTKAEKRTQGEARATRGEKRGEERVARVNPVQVQKFLSGMDYPARKEDLVRKAEAAGADENILATLREMPDGEFRTPADVSQAIGKIK